MKHLALILLLATNGFAIEWKELHPGIETTTLKTKGTFPAALSLFKLDLSKVQLVPAYHKALETKPRVKPMLAKLNGLLGINASFYDEDLMPLGQLRVNGVNYIKRSRSTSLLTGLLCISASEAVSIHKSTSQSCKKSRHVLQIGPRLVSNYKTLPSKNPNKRTRRVGIATTSDKHVILYASTSLVPPTLKEIKSLILEANLKVQNVLNMDGGQSAQLITKDKTYVDGGDPSPVALIVTEK